MNASDLRRRRAQAGMTIQELADTSGVSARTISKIERAESRGAPLTLAKLERVLQDPCKDLLEAANAMLSAFGDDVWFGEKAQALDVLVGAINSYEARP